MIGNRTKTKKNVVKARNGTDNTPNNTTQHNTTPQSTVHILRVWNLVARRQVEAENGMMIGYTHERGKDWKTKERAVRAKTNKEGKLTENMVVVVVCVCV